MLWFFMMTKASADILVIGIVFVRNILTIGEFCKFIWLAVSTHAGTLGTASQCADSGYRPRTGDGDDRNTETDIPRDRHE
jgi:hypothetical protein